MADKQLNNNLAPASLTDLLLTLRTGSPDLSGYLSISALINLIQDETSASNLIIVNEVADLQPYLSGGEYVLPAGKGLFFVKDITLVYPIRLPNLAPCSILGAVGGTGFVNLIYAGAGAFLRATGGFKGFHFQNLNFIQGSPTAKLFDLQNGSNPANWASFGFIWECFATNWTDLGLIEGVNLGLFKAFAKIACATGIELRNWGSLGMTGLAWASGQNVASARYYELKGIIQRLAVIGPCSFLTQSNESVFKIDSSILTERITIVGNSYVGTGRFFASGGLNQDSPYLLSLINPPVPDSKTTAFLSSTTEALTTIAASGTYYPCILPAGGFTAQSAKRFTRIESSVGSGIYDMLRYDGIETIDLDISCKCTARAASGSPTARLAIGRNGTAIDYTGTPATLAATNTPLFSGGIITLQGAVIGTYSQSGTAVTVTLDNTDSAGNFIHTTGEQIYSTIGSGTGVSGLYTITSHNATSITYTAGTSLTTSGNCIISDVLRMFIKNESAGTNIFISNFNWRIIP